MPQAKQSPQAHSFRVQPHTESTRTEDRRWEENGTGHDLERNQVSNIKLYFLC